MGEKQLANCAWDDCESVLLGDVKLGVKDCGDEQDRDPDEACVVVVSKARNP